MAGGIWSVTELPVLPGLYLNFKAAGLAAIQTGARGTVVLPVKAHWGPVGEFVTITSEKNLLDAYAADREDETATAYTVVRLALLGGASKILAYRLASAQARQAVLTLQDAADTPADALRLTALYPGSRGNAFKVTVQMNLLDSAKTDLKLYENSTLLKTFTFATVDEAVATINQDAANVWITAEKAESGGNTLALVSSKPFADGDSGIEGITAAEYTNAMAVFETQEFNLWALDVIDPAIQTSAAAWTIRMREQGKMVMAVMGGSREDDTAKDAIKKAIARTAGFNHEGIVNVGTGTVLDGVTYASAQVAAYVAGLIAGQALSESTTYAASPFDDVTRRWTRTEQEDAVRNGVFIFFHDGRIVKPLRGMNSLITLRQDQNNQFKKIRAIRVMDAINSDLQKAAEDNYIGKINNTEEGRLALIAACKQYMEVMAQGGVIERTGWDVYLNPAYHGANATIKPEPDQVFMDWTARITDVIEQIFGTFLVQ